MRHNLRSMPTIHNLLGININTIKKNSISIGSRSYEGGWSVSKPRDMSVFCTFVFSSRIQDKIVNIQKVWQISTTLKRL
jgi:hypothetical protein